MWTVKATFTPNDQNLDRRRVTADFDVYASLSPIKQVNVAVSAVLAVPAATLAPINGFEDVQNVAAWHVEDAWRLMQPVGDTVEFSFVIPLTDGKWHFAVSRPKPGQMGSSASVWVIMQYANGHPFRPIAVRRKQPFDAEDTLAQIAKLNKIPVDRLVPIEVEDHDVDMVG